MKKKKKRLYVDMDGTLAVFQKVDTMERLYEKGYFYNLKPNRNVVDAVKMLVKDSWWSEEYEVFILTSFLEDSETALKEKMDWLNRYLPEVDYSHRIFSACGLEKSNAVTGVFDREDFLLDDYTKNLDSWSAQGRGIKLLNGINNTKGSWQGSTVAYDADPVTIATAIKRIMRGEVIRMRLGEQQYQVVGNYLRLAEETANYQVQSGIESDKMYRVRLTETLNRDVWIKAADEEAALKKVREQYRDSSIVLDAADFGGVEIEVVEEIERDEVEDELEL